MQQHSLQSGSSSGEFQCRLRSRACALFAGFFPCRRTSDPFSSQYLVSYCRDVEGLSRRRHSSLVPVRRNNEWTILLRPSPPLAPLESVHSFVYRPLTFLIILIYNPYNSIESNSRQDLGIESDPVSIPKREWIVARRSSGVWGCWKSWRLARTD